MTDKIVRYTAGFLFRGDHVLLVQKILPPWQRGLFNAIGGRVEGKESFHSCQRREFREETGLDVPVWKMFSVEEGPGYKVAFYAARTRNLAWTPRDENDVGEKLRWFLVDDVGRKAVCPVVGQLRWLVPLALDWREHDTVIFRSWDDIRERPTW